MEEQNEKKIIDDLRKNLEEANITYQQALFVSGSAQDFYVETPTGGTVTFDVKAWKPTPQNIRYAESLAQSYLKAAGTDYSFVVLPEMKTSDISKGVISVNDVSDVIHNLSFIKTGKKKSAYPKISTKKLNKSIFVAMPFSEQYNDTFAVGIEPACTEFNFASVRIDHENFSGDIVAEIKQRIIESKGVIVDISESRPNVLFELGFATAKNRKIIQICATPKEDIPFNIRNDKTIFYKIGNTKPLNKKLLAIIPEVFN